MIVPIQNLYTFHVVARTGSMQAAAQVLGVTPGAISQRIRAIEDRHGKRLFHRSRAGVVLTGAGLALWNDVGAAMATVESACIQHFGAGKAAMLRISAAPTFAFTSLVPYLGDFTSRYPDIQIAIETEERLVDLRTEPVDLAIRHGLGQYVGLRSDWLNAPELIVVAHPDLLVRHGPLTRPEDCLKFPLLQNAGSADWSIWFAAKGIDSGDARYTTAFKDEFLVVKAVLEGQGLALLSDLYVADDISQGRLAKALDADWPTEFAYYAVALPETFKRRQVRVFVTWLKSVLSEPGR